MNEDFLEDAFHNAFNESYYYQVSGADDNDSESILFHPSPELVTGIRAGIRAVEEQLTPHIRSALYDELIAEDEQHGYWAPDTFGPQDQSKQYHFAHEWLRERKESIG